MQNSRSQGSWIPYALAPPGLAMAAGCAPGSASTLSGVGCADPFCNEEKPETRKVLGCIGEACNEPPPASASKRAAQAAADLGSGAPRETTRSAADATAPLADEAADDPSSLRNLKVYYQRHERR